MTITSAILRQMSQEQLATAFRRYEELIDAMVTSADRLIVKMEVREDMTASLTELLTEWLDAHCKAVRQAEVVKVAQLPNLECAAIAAGFAGYETLVECLIIINNDLLARWHVHPDANNDHVEILNSWSRFHNALFRAHRREIEQVVGWLN